MVGELNGKSRGGITLHLKGVYHDNGCNGISIPEQTPFPRQSFPFVILLSSPIE